MTDLFQCDECGKTTAKRSEGIHERKIPFAVARAKVTHQECAECGFHDIAIWHESMETAVKRAENESLSTMMRVLEDAGFSNVRAERALELSPKTFNRWKGGNKSAAALAMLRMAATYPFLLELAEEEWNPVYAEVCLVKAVERLAYKYGEGTSSVGKILEPTGNAVRETDNVIYDVPFGKVNLSWGREK